jgi:hypothetical protein
MTDEQEKILHRIEYLEKIVDELRYLASCQGYKFDHIDKEYYPPWPDEEDPLM